AHWKAANRLIDLCDGEMNARESDLWNSREVNRARKAADAARQITANHLKQVRYFQRQAAWLLTRFPEAEFVSVAGLCRSVAQTEIESADWSLTPGRYVGVAPPEVDEDFDFEQAMSEIQLELMEL